MIRGSFHSIIVLLILSVSFIGCRKKDEARLELEHIDSLATNGQHRRALELLDSIDHRSLSEPNQNLYDLLVIKARDKDFQQHRSNNVIIRLVDYYRDHPDEWNFAEVLYYGGRVHLDMGDLPSALRYFQEALEYIEDDEKGNIHLRMVLSSQTASIHNSMRKYDSALQLINEAIDLSLKQNDSIAYIYSLELKGSILLHMDSLRTCKPIFDETFRLASKTGDESFATIQQMNKASVEYHLGNTNEALKLIRGVPESIHSSMTGTALGIASKIYLESGYIDSAYIYAKTLSDLKGHNNRKNGYLLIFSPQLISKVPKDSLMHYVSTFSEVMEQHVNKNSDESARLQLTYHNYHTWEQKYVKANREKQTLKNILNIFLAISVFLLGVIITLLLKEKNLKKQKAELLQTLEKTRQIYISTDEKNRNEDSFYPSSEDISQDILRKSILDQIVNKNITVGVAPYILQSPTYREIIKAIPSKPGTAEIKQIWIKLEELVNHVSPHFKHRLEVLSGNNLDPDNYHLALAIKCGISPKFCATLFFLEASSLSYRRKSLVKLLFGNELTLQQLDNTIRAI